LSEKVSNNKRKNLSSRINCSNKLTYERIYGTKVVNPHLLTDSDNAETPNESTANAPDNEDDSHKNMVIEEDKGKLQLLFVISVGVLFLGKQFFKMERKILS
jgi:hypothetical protein